MFSWWHGFALLFLLIPCALLKISISPLRIIHFYIIVYFKHYIYSAPVIANFYCQLHDIEEYLEGKKCPWVCLEILNNG